MAKKSKIIYTCESCGAHFPKWEGRCSQCGAWNSLVEQVEISKTAQKRGWHDSDTAAQVVQLDQPIPKGTQNRDRMKTQLDEFDRVLGGGLVPGSYILLGGDPGIGKSTLLLQAAGALAQQNQTLLYVSGEESIEQTALRARRLGIVNKNVKVACESHMETIVQLCQQHKPDILIVDSIQTVYLSELPSAPGSVSQVRESSAQLMGLAKGMGICVFIIGHVTKDGHIAGPKVLEHMVDTVLSFEGDHSHQFRLLRALKNRFGATNELGVFQMDSEGLKQVSNPSEFFLEERGNDLLGSAVFPALEGTRPLLCEIQGLTTFSPMAMPRRNSIGFDSNRVHLLIAVLDRHLDLELCKADVFVNVVGGLKLNEPCADLAVAASLISTHEHIELDPQAVFFGEVGLTGEVRAAVFAEDRIKEAIKLGFNKFYLPRSNKKHLDKYFKNKSIRFCWIDNIKTLNQELKQTQTNKVNKPRQHNELNF